MARVVTVVADPEVELLLRCAVRGAGHEFLSTADPRTGLRLLRAFRPDVVVVDTGALVRPVREAGEQPVLLLAADAAPELRPGVDLRLPSPVTPDAVLDAIDGLSGAGAEVYEDAWVRVDFHARTVATPAGPVDLTVTEYRLLGAFVRHPDQVLGLPSLLAEVWDDRSGVGPERVKFAVLRLRRKLGWGAADSPVAAVRGVGYRYRPRPARVAPP